MQIDIYRRYRIYGMFIIANMLLIVVPALSNNFVGLFRRAPDPPTFWFTGAPQLLSRGFNNVQLLLTVYYYS